VAGSNSEDEDEDFIDLMKKHHHGRYWAEDNIAIKCHNCHQFGHMAKECPNETKKPACILCGKDTHDSYECTEKMCFKCNQVGHEARNCSMKNIVTCQKCGSVGHKAERCLKVWTPPTAAQLRLMRCIECGKHGHIKCTTEKESITIKISSTVLENLNEFVEQKFQEAENSDGNYDKAGDVDAFDYVKKGKKKKKLTKA